jgi:hypothetical protein
MSDVWWSGGPADRPALEFLRDYGPHTMGTLEDEEAFAAALVFMGLERRGYVTRTDFGEGRLQYAITPAGRSLLSSPAPSRPIRRNYK